MFSPLLTLFHLCVSQDGHDLVIMMVKYPGNVTLRGQVRLCPRGKPTTFGRSRRGEFHRSRCSAAAAPSERK